MRGVTIGGLQTANVNHMCMSEHENKIHKVPAKKVEQMAHLTAAK